MREHVYNNVDNLPVHKTVVSYREGGKKDCKQFHFKNGDWVSGLSGVEPILYNENLLNININFNEPYTVYIVEGEKDADNLMEYGLLATTNPMGAGKWRDAYSMTGFFAKIDVVILVDNDAVGREHGEAVALSLYRYGGCKSIRVVDLSLSWVEMPPKGDVSDYLEQGTIEQLLTFCANCPVWNPPKFERRLAPTAYDIMNFPPPTIEPLWGEFVPYGEVLVLYGSSDTGKSMFLSDLSLAIADRRKEFCGFKLNIQRGRVLFISTEDGEELKYASLKKQTADMSSFDNLQNLRFVFSPNEVDIPSLLDAEPIDLLIVDCLSDVFTGDLNNAQDVRKWFKTYKGFAAKYKCSVIILHHSGKNAETLIPSKHNMVGSQALPSACRAAFEFRQDANSSLLRHLCITKANYLGAEYKQSSYELEFNPLTLKFNGAYSRGREIGRTPFEQLITVATNGQASHTTDRTAEISPRDVFRGTKKMAAAEIAEQIEKMGFKKRWSADWIAKQVARGGIKKAAHGVYEIDADLF